MSIRPDVVHCHATLPDGLWVLLASRLFGVTTRLVVTSHGGDIVWLPEIPYGIRQSYLMRLLCRFVTRRVDAHAVVSGAMVRHAVDSGTPSDRVRVIPNGIPTHRELDFEEEQARQVQSPAVPAAHQASGDGINILCLSSNRPMKNLGSLIEAFSQARSELGTSRLWLACAGPTAKHIVDVVREKGLSDRVDFIGEVTGQSKLSYFRASDLYCVPSRFEPFGIVALEAMKYESAVLASTSGGALDFVVDGENGVLVSPTDVDEIASALVRIYRNPEFRTRLTRNGRKTVGAFAISRVIDEYILLYQEVMGVEACARAH